MKEPVPIGYLITVPAAWAAVGLAVLTAAGLVVVARRGLQAGPAVQQALDAGLGAGWRDAIDAGLAARLRRRLPWTRILLRPLFVRRGDVERVANLRYGDAGRRNLLDLYRHRSHPSGGPRSSTCTAGPSAAAARTARPAPCCTGWPARAGCASAPTTG